VLLNHERAKHRQNGKKIKGYKKYLTPTHGDDFAM
jgi:hypothetical protein